MKKFNNKGFSLVELIIVIAIMVVLVGIAAPQFIKYVESSRSSTDMQNMELVKTAIEVVATNDDFKSASVTISNSAISWNVLNTSDATIDLDGVSGTSIALKSTKWGSSGSTATYNYNTTSGWSIKSGDSDIVNAGVTPSRSTGSIF